MTSTNNRGNARKGWCITINNYTPLDMLRFQNVAFEYSIFGKEVAPTTGTPHLQGYLHFKNKVRFTAVKKLFPTNGDIRPADGNATQNKVYCSKDMDFQEYGVCPMDGAETVKSDWDDIREAAKENRLEDIDAERYIKYYSTLKKIAADVRNRNVPADLNWKNGHSPNTWIYGPTGTGKLDNLSLTALFSSNCTGKSFKARSENPGFYSKMNNKWWENYEDQETVLIEDIGQTHLWMGDFLKIWADRYGFRSEIKNASVVLRPKRIIVTSNYHPKDLWPDESVHEPILRRFKIIHLEKLMDYDTRPVGKPPLTRTQPRLFTPFDVPKNPLFMQNNGILEPYINKQVTIDQMLSKPTAIEICSDTESMDEDPEKMIMEPSQNWGLIKPWHCVDCKLPVCMCDKPGKC